MRVLLIDDEQFYFKLIRKTLKEAEYELEYAKTGNEGLSKIPTFEPDMMIVDLKLPEMDGFEILERLRRDPKYSHVPVIVITAKTQSIDKVLGLIIAKVEDYISKPFSPQDLLESVEKVFSQSVAPEEFIVSSIGAILVAPLFC